VIQTQIDEYYLEQNQQDTESMQERFAGPDSLTQIDENQNETENTDMSEDDL
jgi:hypothetical protein